MANGNRAECIEEIVPEGIRVGHTPTLGCVLVVDEDGPTLRRVAETLSQEGFNVLTAISVADAITQVMQNRVDLMLLDMRFSEAERELVECGRSVPFIIIISGHGDQRAAVEMMKR